MGLDWNVERVKVVPDTKEEREAWYAQVSYEQPKGQSLTNWQLIEALIWRSLSLCWGWELTEAKVETAIKRNAIYENVGDRGNAIPPAFIADMVGFSTNVSEATHAAFMKSVRSWLERDADAVYRRHVEAVTKARKEYVDELKQGLGLADPETQRDAEVDASIAEHETRIAEES